MQIDIETETLVTLTEATKSKLFPKKPSVCTMTRWCLNGVRGEILESAVIGGRRFTSVEAIHRFVAATSRHPRLSRPVNTKAAFSRKQICSSDAYVRTDCQPDVGHRPANTRAKYTHVSDGDTDPDSCRAEDAARRLAAKGV